MKTEKELKSKLVVGCKIRIGDEYAKKYGWHGNRKRVITLIKGYFDYDNGLYCETQTAPSIKYAGEYESIYHLFGNKFENWMDCEIVFDKALDDDEKTDAIDSYFNNYTIT